MNNPVRKIPENFSFKKLFISTFLISAFTVGGGFVIIPLLKMKYVDEYGWLDDKETLDLVAIAQSTPGVLAANASIMLGYRVAGILGAFTALTATIIPPLITLSIIAVCYDAFATNPYVKLILKGMQCGATALILNVMFDLISKQLKKKLVLPIIIMTATFIGALFFRANMMMIIIIDGLLGLWLMRSKQFG